MTFRALEPTDIDLLYTIENDPELWDVSGCCIPYSRYDLENYILSQQHDLYADKQLRLVIVAEGQGDAEGRAVGLLDLFNYSPAHHRAELGLAILKSERGKGYATSALQAFMPYAHDKLHLHQLYCIVPADNAASLAMLRTTGFTHEVTLPEWLNTPAGYRDCISLFRIL